MPARRPSPVGAHVPVAAGLVAGLRYADRIGAQAIQVFTSNPRGWAPSPGDPKADAAFRTGVGSRPVFVHAPYLVNLGSPTPATRERSLGALDHALVRAAAIGARGVVVHAGSAVAGARRDVAFGQLREALLPLLDRCAERAPETRVLIEPTAGGGQPLACRVGDLEEYFAVLEQHPMLGVCLDTCHAHAAGHDLRRPGGVRTLLSALRTAVGRGRLGLLHANDSKDPVGSSRDRHHNIGAGTIGEAAFAELFVHPVTRDVPVVVETPGEEAGHARDVATLKALRDASR